MKRHQTLKLAVTALFLSETLGCALNTEPTQREQAAGIGALAGYYYGDKLMPSPASRSVKADDDTKSKVTFADVVFEFDSAQIKKDAMPYIDPLVAYLKKNPSRRVWIEGHTDNVGTGAYNLDLSTRRAEAVRDVLTKAGIGPQRIAATGLGEAKPIASNDTAEGRTMNRRVEVEVF